MLKGKVAVITGGTRGIGRAIAQRFLDGGADVVLFGVNRERGEQVVKELAKEGQRVLFLPVDVADGQQVEKAIEEVMRLFGAVDILVNNAGITRDGLLMRMKEEDWRAVLDTNLSSVYHTCRLVIRGMMKARRGCIINISSVVGLMGNAGQTNYAASKAGMIGFTKALAHEVSARGINVNCVAPGFIDTDMTRVLSSEQKEALLRTILMRRLGHPKDVAEVVFFLATPGASYMTGQVLTVDGGMVM